MASGMAVYLVGQCEKRKKGGKKKTFTYLKVGSHFHLVWRREEKRGPEQMSAKQISTEAVLTPEMVRI